MAVTTIARRAGVSLAFVAQLANGYRMEKGQKVPVTKIHRDKEAAILAVRYEDPAGPNLGTGARLPAIGAQRRIQALARAGFPFEFQGRVIYGFPHGFRPVQRILTADGLYAATFNVIRDGYEKYQNATPAEAGVGARQATYIRHLAERRGYAPRGCWDPETIDDPDAIPEWTGYCGTGLGTVIHRRDRIPVCQPCAEAFDYRDPYPGFSGERFRVLRESRKISRTKLGRLVGVDGSTFKYWETGRSRPQRQGKLDLVLFHLDADFSDVCDIGEGHGS